MKFFRSKTNIIFSCITFILVGALICSTVVIKKKNSYISSVKAQITENESKLAEEKKRIEEFEAQIAEKDKANTDISAKLDAAQKEKKKLEDENAALKKKIATLSAQKAEAAQKPVAPAVTQPAAPSGEKICYLTFDDGPSDNTLKILEILNRYNAKATFFVINSNKIGYVKNIHAAGHTVGLHTSSHDYSKIYTSETAYFNDLNAISAKVESLIGIKSTVIRFPGGSSNKVSLTQGHCRGLMTRLVKLVGERGYSYFDWNVGSGDADSVTPSYTKIKNNVLSGAKNKNSICVLMHDTEAKTTTVQALPEIIEGLIQMGYRFEALKPGSYGYHHQKLNN